jgi:hypothetical protein
MALIRRPVVLSALVAVLLVAGVAVGIVAAHSSGAPSRQAARHGPSKGALVGDPASDELDACADIMAGYAEQSPPLPGYRASGMWEWTQTGSFSVSWGGQTTGALAFSATLGSILSAVQALPGLSAVTLTPDNEIPIGETNDATDRLSTLSHGRSVFFSGIPHDDPLTVSSPFSPNTDVQAFSAFVTLSRTGSCEG